MDRAEVLQSKASDGRSNVQRQPVTEFMLVTVTRESAIMTQTIYVRRCDPGWAGRPGSLGVAGCRSLISPGVAGRGAATPRDPANPGHEQAVMRNEAFPPTIF